jgi:hypothetical protein
MAGTGVLDLYTQTEALYDACVEALDMIPTFSPGLGGAPERSFIAQGTPVIPSQCDQLAVAAIPLAEAPTQPLEMGAGTRHQQQFRKNYVRWRIWITRCADVSEIPVPVTALDAIAQQTYADAWALWNYVWNMARAGEIFTICGGVYFDSLDPLTPSGGVYGSVLNIRAEVEGFEGVPT